MRLSIPGLCGRWSGWRGRRCQERRSPSSWSPQQLTGVSPSGLSGRDSNAQVIINAFLCTEETGYKKKMFLYPVSTVLRAHVLEEIDKQTSRQASSRQEQAEQCSHLQVHSRSFIRLL